MVSSRTPRCQRGPLLGRSVQLALRSHQPVFHQPSTRGPKPRLAAEGWIHPVLTATAAAAGTSMGYHLQPGGGCRAKLAATLQQPSRAGLPFHPPFSPGNGHILSSSMDTSSTRSSNNIDISRNYKSPAAAHDGGRGWEGRTGRGGSSSQDGGRQGRDEGWVASGSGRGVGGQGGWGAGRGGGGGGGGRGRGRGGGVGGRGHMGGDAGDSPFSNIRDKGFAELQQLVQQYGGSMKQGDLIAIVSRLKFVPAASLEQKVNLLKQLLQLLEPQLQHLQPRGLAEVMLTCSKLGYGDAGLYRTYLGVFVSKLQQADARTLENAIYATATTLESDTTRQQCWPVVEQQLLPAFMKAVADAAPQGIANVVWGTANLGEKLSNLQLQELVECLLTQMGAADPQAIANTIWGVATMGQQLPDQQVQLLVAELVKKLDTAKPQAIANTIWGIATMGQQLPDQQVQLLVAGLVDKLVAAKPQDIANTIWGVATMGQQLPDQQVQLLVAGLVDKLDAAKPQAIANTVWGVATMGQQVRADQLQQLLKQLVHMLAIAKPVDISHTVWGIATMGQQLPAKQLQQLLKVLALTLPSAHPQALSNTMWGLASLQPQPFLPEPLLRPEAKQAIIRKLPAMIPQDLATIARACGVLGYRDEQLLFPLFSKAREVLLLDEGSSMGIIFKCQELANMCWAGAVLDMQQLISHVEQFAAAVSSKWEEAVPEEKQQLYQVHMWLLDQQSNSTGLVSCLTKQQLQDCREQWQKGIAEIVASAKASSAHRAVYAAAQQLSFSSQPPELEARTADGLHSIDVLVVTSGGVKVAIEVDGPQHFRQPDLQPTGPTQWRNRSLAARGYVVVSVPTWEWVPLLPEQHVAYLKGKVQQALAGAGAKRKRPPSQ